MVAELLAEGVWWVDCCDESVVAVENEGHCDPVLRITRDVRRARSELVFLSGTRSVDLSTRPAAILRVLADRNPGSDSSAWNAGLARNLHRRGDEWDLWRHRHRADGDTLEALGGLTHPVLGLAYDAGVEPAGEIPLWTSPALARTTVADTARVMFGPKWSSSEVLA